jgi:hypothetical protein
VCEEAVDACEEFFTAQNKANLLPNCSSPLFLSPNCANGSQTAGGAQSPPSPHSHTHRTRTRTRTHRTRTRTRTHRTRTGISDGAVQPGRLPVSAQVQPGGHHRRPDAVAELAGPGVRLPVPRSHVHRHRDGRRDRSPDWARQYAQPPSPPPRKPPFTSSTNVCRVVFCVVCRAMCRV